MVIFTRNCIRGELKLKMNQCYKCPIGRYSLEVKNIACRACPRNADCLGGDLILAHKNFWQSSNHSAMIHDCEEYREFCLGRSQYYKNPCIKGHFGPFCKSCDQFGIHYNKVRYHNTKKLNCDICPSNNRMQIIIFCIGIISPIIFISIISIVSIYTMENQLKLQGIIQEKTYKREENIEIVESEQKEIRKQLQNKFIKRIQLFKSISMNKKQQRIKKQKNENINDLKFQNSVKLIMHFTTCLPMVLTNQFEDALSNFLTRYLSMLTTSITLDPRNSFYHFECTLSHYFNDVYFADILIELIVPYFDALVLIIVWASIFRKQTFSKYKLIGMLTVLFISQQPIQIARLFQTLKCKDLDEGQLVIFEQPNIFCNEGQYNQQLLFFIIPSLILFVFIYPTFILNNIQKLKSKNNLQTPSGCYQQGFLFIGYKENAFYWEFSKIFLRVLLLFFSELITVQLMAKEVLCCSALALYCIIFQMIQPYDSDLDQFNSLDFNTNVVLFLNTFQSQLAYSLKDADALYWVIFREGSFYLVVIADMCLMFILMQNLFRQLYQAKIVPYVESYKTQKEKIKAQKEFSIIRKYTLERSKSRRQSFSSQLQLINSQIQNIKNISETSIFKQSSKKEMKADTTQFSILKDYKLKDENQSPNKYFQLKSQASTLQNLKPEEDEEKEVGIQINQFQLDEQEFNQSEDLHEIEITLGEYSLDISDISDSSDESDQQDSIIQENTKNIKEFQTKEKLDQ